MRQHVFLYICSRCDFPLAELRVQAGWAKSRPRNTACGIRQIFRVSLGYPRAWCRNPYVTMEQPTLFVFYDEIPFAFHMNDHRRTGSDVINGMVDLVGGMFRECLCRWREVSGFNWIEGVTHSNPIPLSPRPTRRVHGGHYKNENHHTASSVNQHSLYFILCLSFHSIRLTEENLRFSVEIQIDENPRYWEKTCFCQWCLITIMNGLIMFARKVSILYGSSIECNKPNMNGQIEENRRFHGRGVK